jgi:hypothetical protein
MPCGLLDRDNPGASDSFQWVAVSAKFANRDYDFASEDKVQTTNSTLLVLH